jgi:KDO2-lipid IV(A) lauroyltransferase
MLMWGERLPQGRGWRVRVRQAPALPADAADEQALQLACATVVNQAMERLIAERPEQYLWGYHRYKQPRGELAAS